MPDAKVFKFENLPVELHKRVKTRWLLYLAVGFSVTLMTPSIVGYSFYSCRVLQLPETDAPLDLSVSISGCDVQTVLGSRAEAHLSYYTLLGSGWMEIVNKTLRVDAMYSRRVLMLGCRLILHLPELERGFHFNSVNMSIQPDASSEGDDYETSMTSISLSHLRVRGSCHLDVSATARTFLADISAASLEVHAKGGYVGLRHRKPADGKVGIHAQDAMVSIRTDGVPLQAEMSDELFKYAALAAPVLHHQANNNKSASMLRAYQLSGMPAAGWHSKPVQLMVHGEGSTAYIQASDPGAHHEHTCKTKLQVVRGSAAAEEGTVLLPSTRELLGRLSKWLQSEKMKQEPRYVVNLHLLTPNAPPGMLKLLSSPVYHAMSLSLASLVTGGMLRPSVHRIVAPVSGMSWLFPEDGCNHSGVHHEEDGYLHFGTQQLQAVSPEVDIVGMNLTSARWIWDPKGSKAYVFDKVDEKHGFFWRPRHLTLKDFWIFLAASGITLVIGLAAGVVVLLILWVLVIPSLKEQIQKNNLFMTASYRMQHSRDSETWSLHPTMVHWPTRGVLLRWAKRPKGMQFHTICVQARLWPDAASVEGYKGVVRTHHIHFHKLPAPQEFPDMKCFLFVVDPKQDVGREARSMTAVDNELAALGKLQAAQEQSPLHAGKSYQFQVIAYDDEGSVVETSAWSRPTTIDVRRKFVELPLLLWQGWCRIVPSSTFKYFVKKHCVTLPKDPAMRLRLKQLRLTLVSPGAECLAGAPPAPAGAETPLEQVQVLFSTSGGKLKATDQVLLPSRDERKERRLQKPMSEVFPGSVRADAGQQCVVLDAFQKAIEIDVGSDLSEQLTIEVSVTSEDGKETTAAKWKSDWSHLLDVFSHRRSAKQELSDEIVLLEGLTPVAFLSARFEISNPCLPSTARPHASPAANEDFPDIFEKIRPGCAVYWSESVKLEWDVPTENQDTDVEVVLVGYELDISKLARKKIVPRSSSFSTTLCSLKLRAGQQTVVMCPPQLLQDGMMCCHMQAFVNQEGTRKLVLCSHQFAVVRPILIQDLELCYAGFCARRGIRMEQVDVDRFGDFGIRTTERLLHVARGFRAPLPVPHELKVVQHEEELRAMAPDSPNLILIENGPSVILSSEDDPMQLRYCSLSQEIHGVHAKQPSKFGRQLSVAKTQEALTTPLLSAGEDDEQAQAPIAPVTPTTPVSPNSHKPRTVDGHRQSVEIPTNVFWRRSADWVSDPLLKYALLPNFVAETQDPLEICLRGVLLTLMFWVQFAALLVPVMCLHALVVWHDAIRAVTRSDLFSQDTEHFFLLDFVMEPTPFRFANLDYATKLILGSSLLYFMLIGATVAYSMVIGLPKPLPADGFFEGADRIIMCVTSVLVAGTSLVVTNALVWIVLGSLIRPADLIPYAIMLAAVVTMGHSMLSKFRGMKKYCESKMTTLLDAALVAIFKVMAGDRQILNDVEEKKEEFEHLKDKVSHLVPKGEQHMREAMTQMVKDGRNQPGTKEFLKALEKGRKQPVKAQDLKAAEKQRKVKKLAKGLAVHTATVELMLDCFDNFVILKRLSEDSAAHANSSASTLSTLISTARKDCLFGHFLRPDKGKDNKDEDKAPEPKEAKIHPDPESEPRVLSLLYHLQNEEMERMDAVVAQCLSKCLNWSFISRQVDVFCSQTLPSGVVLNAVEREVSVVVQGSAAAQVILGAFQVGYELFETRYRTNPLEIFSDCGLLTADVVKRPQVQFILNSEIDAQLKGGSELSPKALIAAVRSICLQNEKVALTTGSQPKAYFWYKALVAVLKDLGWSKEELEPSKGWLQQRWEELTDGCGLFEYSSTEEVVSLVLRISNGGLWKAAAKSMLLKAGVGGYACCQGIPKEAAEMARELEGCNVLDLSLVNEKCDWPPDVTKLWEECATVASPDGPSFLHASKVLQFMEALVYEPAEDKTEEAKQKLVPLSPFANSMEDLAWQKETGKAPSLWHVKPSGRRKLRGLWLELVLQIFDSMDCIPSDLDLFFECQAATEKNGAVSFVLHLHKFKAWLKRDYFSKLTDCTFNQFKVIVQDMLKCQIPEEALKEEVFDICPTIPDDDQGELRAISDLGAALFAYTDHGLWSEAMRLVAKRLLAAGPVRDYALNHLDDEFAAHDVAKRGVLSISEAMDMLQSVAVPGLTCSDLARLLEKELGIEVPRAELHKYFTTMDVNGDGLLQDEEFVQVIRFLMLDYYPHHILKHLHLTLGQITLFVFGALLTIGVVFLLVTLVIDFFKAGEDVAATLHGGFSAIFGVVGKRLSDEGIGFEDTMKNLELKLESMMVTALVMVLGLSKEMQDVFRSVLTSAEELAASRS